MKPLKPSHREKKRYLLIKGKDATKKAVDEAILEFIGVLGYGQASPQVVKSGAGKIILAINHKSLNQVRASFVMSGKDLQVVKVSGILNKIK